MQLDVDEKDPSGEQLLDEGSISSEEEAFMRGYSDEDEVVACAECGTALREKVVIKSFEGEKYKFCCEDCAKEYEEGLC